MHPSSPYPPPPHQYHLPPTSHPPTHNNANFSTNYSVSPPSKIPPPKSNLLLTGLIVCTIIAIVSGALILIDGRHVLAQFNLSAEMEAMELQLAEDIDDLAAANVDATTLAQFRQRLATVQDKKRLFLYAEEDFTTIKTLYDDVTTLRNERYSTFANDISKQLLSCRLKFDELTHYGLSLGYKQQELTTLEDRLEKAESVEDFQILDQLSTQLDVFLNDQLTVQKTIYLQDHLEEELELIRGLIADGKKIGVHDEALETVVAEVALKNTTSSAEYIFQLEKHEKLLVDGKLRLKESIEEKKRKIEEERKRQRGIIPDIPPTHPLAGKSIEVSINEQVMRLYEDSVQVRAFYVVTGKKGWETTRGVHKIFYKQKNKVLSMDYPDYYRIPVKYWMPFTSEGQGIHDATYRSQFGPKVGRTWNGSHGCVNSPLEAAKYVYEWSSIGTPVVVY